jgi:signal transduction histidine kinase
VADPSRGWWTRLRAGTGTVRFRATLAAVAIVGIAFVAGSIGVVVVLRSTLTDEVRDATFLRADDVLSALKSGTSPDRLVTGVDDDFQIQVLDERGTLIAATPELDGKDVIGRLRPGHSTVIRLGRDNERFLAVTKGAATADGHRTVVTARTLEPVAETTRVVGRLLLLGLPLLLLLVGFTTWKLVGRALAPVDAIRAEVDEISAVELHRRVPAPAGTDEIARLAATMNRMLDRLELAQRRQQQFVSDASHELRSPVASIREQAEVALAHPERMTTTDLAEHVLAEDLRVQRLVEDLLLLARADEQILRLKRRPVDLDDLVFEAARRLRAASSLRIDTTDVSAARVLGDAAGLRRVVANLADNALRHARTRVAFSLAAADHTVVLAVDDDGDGIPPEDRARVFERFVRLDDARARDAGGSGLGLAIVAQLVDAHGGSVAIVDGTGGGTRVEIRLDAAPSPN